MSSGLSRSILNILPVDSASMSTLFATCAATKSAAIEKASCTGSTLKMGSWPSPLLLSARSPAAKPPPLDIGCAMSQLSHKLGDFIATRLIAMPPQAISSSPEE